MVRDEVDVIADTLRAMAAQVDYLLVADNGSRDGTRDALEALRDEVELEVVDDDEVAYYQSAKMTGLALRAIDRGASWIVPFDADEIWEARDARLGDLLEGLPDWAPIAEADLYDYVATGADPPRSSPLDAIRYRRATASPLPKVAVRGIDGLTIRQGNHGAAFPGVASPPRIGGRIWIRHYPYRSPEQFVRKVRNGAEAYAASKLPRSEGAHWRQYGAILEAEGPDALVENVYRKWFYRTDPLASVTIDGELQSPLVFDPWRA